MKKLCKSITAKVRQWYVGKPTYFPYLVGYYDQSYQIGTTSIVYDRHWTSRLLRNLIELVKLNPFGFCMVVLGVLSLLR